MVECEYAGFKDFKVFTLPLKALQVCFKSILISQNSPAQTPSIKGLSHTSHLTPFISHPDLSGWELKRFYRHLEACFMGVNLSDAGGLWMEAKRYSCSWLKYYLSKILSQISKVSRICCFHLALLFLWILLVIWCKSSPYNYVYTQIPKFWSTMRVYEFYL